MGVEGFGDGIKTRLVTITGLRVFAPNELPDSLSEFPVALVLPGETLYNSVLGSKQRTTMRVLLVLAKPDQPSALNKLLDYIDPTGAATVVGAIDGDATLNAKADTARVVRNTGVGSITWGGQVYLGTEFEIDVMG